MLRHALKSDDGFGPLAFEMKTVAHLMKRGFNVEFHDIDEGGGFDYLATNEDVEIEIECKFVSGDIGRQLHLKEFHQLSTILRPVISDALDQRNGGYLALITIPGKLEPNNQQHQKICSQLKQALVNREFKEKIDGYEISVSDIPITDDLFDRISQGAGSLNDLRRFLFDKHGIENRNVVFYSNPKKGIIFVVVGSAKKDTVLKAMHSELKASARRQFSGDRPGILCCYLAELSQKELLDLRNHQDEGIGLQFMVSDLIARRPKIHSVVFTTPGSVEIQRSETETWRHLSVQENSSAYTFSNPDHQLATDPRYDIF
jgi:hypothetical protein